MEEGDNTSAPPGTQANPTNPQQQLPLPTTAMQLPPGMQLPLGMAPPVAMLPPGLMLAPGLLPAPMMQVAMPADPETLSQETGFDVKVLRENPGMIAAAQQLLAQRWIQQQFAIGAAAAMPGMITSQQMQVLQQQRLQQQQAKPQRAPAKPKAKKNGNAQKPEIMPKPEGPLLKEDPGGKVIWAKLSNNPWWPAKTLDPTKDKSFPSAADPPRPTAIPIRFFGTHEFGWLGSKRAVVDWEAGFDKFSKESDQDTFKAAIEEAQAYLKDATLPDVFYMTPEGQNEKKTQPKATGGRKRGAGAPRKNDPYMDYYNAGFAPPAGAPAPAAKAKTGRGTELTPQERAALVFERKKQRLLDLGLLPPSDSPFTKGHAAPNPELLAKQAEWETSDPGAMISAREKAAKMVDPPRASVYKPPPESAAPLQEQTGMLPPGMAAIPLGMAGAQFMDPNAAFAMNMNMGLAAAAGFGGVPVSLASLY